MGGVAFVCLAALGIVSVMVIGAGVPIATIYYTVNYGLSVILSGIISVVALGCAAILGFIIVLCVFEEHGSDLLSEEMSPSEEEKLNALRAHLRASLEELDEINVLLKNIRDVLREVGE